MSAGQRTVFRSALVCIFQSARARAVSAAADAKPKGRSTNARSARRLPLAAPLLAQCWTPPALRAYYGWTMERLLCIVAAVICTMLGCGNERNGYSAAKTYPHTAETKGTMGRPGDHWVDTMQFVRVARAQRDNQYGYKVTYEAPGGTTLALFWSRDQIDLRGALPNYRLENMPLDGGRLLYPDKLTRESLPDVYQAIQLIEDGHARDAEGAITAAEMFGVVAALGGAAPTPRTGGPIGQGAPSRASIPRARAARASTPTQASVADKLTRYLLNPAHPVGGPKG